jgi:hypothetical protein
MIRLATKAPKSVNTEPLSAERTGEDDCHDDREQALGWLRPFECFLAKPAGQVRLDNKEHGRNKNQHENEAKGSGSKICRPGESDEEREQPPRCCVANRGASGGNLP